MTQIDTKKIVINLIDTFFEAGKICINLRNKGLKTEIKTDNTPVSNGDIEVNNIITNKIKADNRTERIDALVIMNKSSVDE